MGNMREMFLKAANGKRIIGCAIGHYDQEEWRGDPRGMSGMIGKLLPWAQLAPHLDYEYDNSLGGERVHPVYAWTADRVIFIHEYDGATHAHWVPRHPTDCVPLFDGTE